MIDPQKECVISLSEAAAAVPLAGAKPHLSTIWRWCRKGIGGVRLEYLRVGRRIVTSREALGRFFQAVAQLDDNSAPAPTAGEPPVQERTTLQRKQAIERANRTLQKAGI